MMTENEEAPKEEPKDESKPGEKLVDETTFEYMSAKFIENIGTLKPEQIKPEEFEKDEDTNYHIDAIYSMANCR